MKKENYTSLELSRKLHEAGCKLESEYVYVDTRKSWKKYNHYNTKGFIPFNDIDESDYECELVKNEEPFPNKGYNESSPLPAYDFLNDIACKYASSFFGEYYKIRSEEILHMLYQKRKQEAEKYIEQHSLFFKKDHE